MKSLLTRKRILTVLGVMSVLGSWVTYIIVVPQSQPCWPKPLGYLPDLLDKNPDPTLDTQAPHLTEPITLLLRGDVMIGRGVARHLKRRPRHQVFTSLNVPKSVDIIHFNLESVVSELHPEWPWKMYRFRSESSLLPRALSLKYLTQYRSAQKTSLVVSLANNHALDFGREGLRETLKHLDQAGVAHVGAGLNTTQAWSPKIIERRGQSVGFLSITDHCGCLDMCGWLPTPARSGVAYAYLSGGAWETLLEATRRLRARVEVVVISLHSGPNYMSEVPDWQQELGRALIDAGATIIVMHSAHHVLPYERYRSGLIFYALGDLMNDYRFNQKYRSDLGATALVKLHVKEPPTVVLRLHKIVRRHLKPLKSNDPDTQLTLSRLNSQ